MVDKESVPVGWRSEITLKLLIRLWDYQLRSEQEEKGGKNPTDMNSHTMIC